MGRFLTRNRIDVRVGAVRTFNAWEAIPVARSHGEGAPMALSLGMKILARSAGPEREEL